MRLGVKTNVDKVFNDLDAFMKGVQTVALPRALNRLRDQAQVAGLREVARIYDVGPRTMEKYLTVTLASPAQLEAGINVKGSRFPIGEMKPIQTKAGVSVMVKGRRVLIPHAFMVKRFGKHVFARGAYGGKGGVRGTGSSFGRFQFGRGRLPIGEIYTFGPAETMANAEVVNAMQDRTEEQASSVLRREIGAARRGF